MNWPKVIENDPGIRPAGKPDECFYCHRKVGQEHGRECVIVNKKVKVRYIYTFEIDVPHFWDERMILFHRNDSTWCANNGISELEDYFAGDDKGCSCSNYECEFIEDVDLTPFRSEK